MDLLVMDLTGPMSVPTWNGYLYVLVVVEVSCYYAVSCLLKEKEETNITIQNIMAMMEHQSGLKACQLWSDNGSKFMNKTMEQFCWLNSIIFYLFSILNIGLELEWHYNYTLSHISHIEYSKRFEKTMMSYNIYNICWPHD